MLASIAKSPREYAPTARDTGAILRRRNQTLVLMASDSFISREQTVAVRIGFDDNRSLGPKETGGRVARITAYLQGDDQDLESGLPVRVADRAPSSPATGAPLNPQ